LPYDLHYRNLVNEIYEWGGYVVVSWPNADLRSLPDGNWVSAASSAKKA